MKINIKPRIPLSVWTELPSKIRGAMRKKFQIKNDQCSEVEDNRVISDGISEGLLNSVFSIAKMQKFLKSKNEDVSYLLQNVIETVMAEKEKNGDVTVWNPEEEKPEEEEAEPVSEPKKAKKPAKKAKKGAPKKAKKN